MRNRKPNGTRRRTREGEGPRAAAAEPMRLDEVLRDLAPILQGLTEKDTSVTVSTDVTAPFVVFDRPALQQILIDLVVNAREAIENGGDIAVTLNRVSADDAPDDWVVRPDGGGLRLTVWDTGRGIPGDRLSSLVADDGEGALARSRRAVREAGGELSLESEVGRGTRVDLFLPEASDDEPTLPVTVTGFVNAPDPILVVDDEPLVRSLVRRYLERDGFRVTEAVDGDEAWRILNERPGEFGLLLSDIRMPGTDGLTLAGKVSDAFPELDILLMTGFAVEIVGAGGSCEFRVLAKPFDRDELLEAIQAVTTR